MDPTGLKFCEAKGPWKKNNQDIILVVKYVTNKTLEVQDQIKNDGF